MFSIADVIDIAIQLEQNAERFYLKAKRSSTIPEVAVMMEWLAGQEREHIEWFNQLGKDVKRVNVNSEVENMGKELLRNAVKGQSFCLSQKKLSEIEDVTALMRLAIEFEEDTSLFYEMIRPFIGKGKVRTQLDRIIAEEERHVQTLRKLNGAEIKMKG